jgi:hypothetical protein
LSREFRDDLARFVGAELHATGAFDARGTSGISRGVPIGAQEISIVAELQTDADDATLAKLAELTERFCVVGQSLAQPPSIPSVILGHP